VLLDGGFSAAHVRYETNRDLTAQCAYLRSQSMIIDLNHTIPSKTPTPPPWTIRYDNSETTPVAYTKGLLRFGEKELEIRQTPPKAAATLLDRLAIWLVYEQNKARKNQLFTKDGYTFALCRGGDRNVIGFRTARSFDPEGYPKVTERRKTRISSRLARP